MNILSSLTHEFLSSVEHKDILKNLSSVEHKDILKNVGKQTVDGTH